MIPEPNNLSQISDTQEKTRKTLCNSCMLGTRSEKKEKHLNKIVIAGKAFLKKGCFLQVLKLSLYYYNSKGYLKDIMWES